MKTKIFFSIILSCVLIFSCKKENIQPGNGSGSSVPSTGTLYFKNNQSDPYTLYLDGSNIGVLQAGSLSSGYYSVSAGTTHSIKAEQFSGYILYPTVFTGTVTLNPGGTVTWEF